MQDSVIAHARGRQHAGENAQNGTITSTTEVKVLLDLTSSSIAASSLSDNFAA